MYLRSCHIVERLELGELVLRAADGVAVRVGLPDYDVASGELGVAVGSVNVVVINSSVHFEGFEQLDARCSCLLQFLQSNGFDNLVV